MYFLAIVMSKGYNAAGALITWNSGGANNDSFNFGGGTYGACTDGTYIYAIDTGHDTYLYRRTIVGNVASTITMSQVFTVKLEIRVVLRFITMVIFMFTKMLVNSNIDKINVTTGAVTELTGCNVGSYSAGAILTQAVNGKFYIIEVGSGANQNNIIDLSTFTRSSITMVSLGVSTEYGNLGMEIQPGVGIILL